MRQNAAAMDKLVATNRTTAPQGKTAVDDLNTYEKFAQAHVDGLKNLISSFKTLYTAMPDAQKKNADEVFNAFGTARPRGKGLTTRLAIAFRDRDTTLTEFRSQ